MNQVITGRINSLNEAVVRLWIRGPELDVLETDVIVDTGFNGFLTLPAGMASELGIRFEGRGRTVLADGSERFFEYGEAMVFWNGRIRAITISVVENAPLLGMALLYGSELAVQVTDGGEVAIRELWIS